MKKIACLAWGSLVWDPRELPVQGKWFEDGPMIKVEFTRQSKDGRITLVLNREARFVRSLWGLMETGDLAEAKEALKKREGCHFSKIGSWEIGEEVSQSETISNLPDWAKNNSVEAVIWTDLPSKFNGIDNKIPTCDEVIAYLAGLTGRQREKTEEYIRRAPPQTDTLYRRKIEAELGWKPVSVSQRLVK